MAGNPLEFLGSANSSSLSAFNGEKTWKGVEGSTNYTVIVSGVTGLR